MEVKAQRSMKHMLQDKQGKFLLIIYIFYRNDKSVKKGLELFKKPLTKRTQNKIKNIKNGLFEFTAEKKDKIKEFFTANGYQFVECLGEADVHLHRLPGDNTVMSKDSDFLLMENVTRCVLCYIIFV